MSVKKSYFCGVALSVLVLAGCGSSHKAPISSVGGYSSGGASAGTYVVQRGDTLYSIARRYGVSVKSLLSMNNISNPSQIEVGQRIRVGGGGSSGSSSSKTPVSRPSGVTSGAFADADTSTRASDANLVSWGWPYRGNIITAYSTSTRGIDIAGKIGDPVKAAADGKVSYVGNGLRGLGNLVLITHSNGFISAYAHNSKLLVKQNQRVSKGQTIAELGQSDTSSPRLHFEIRRNGRPVNPQAYLPH
ncbi:peptidoglycan DD-metalloendopeptidase family protein [Pelistega europaea]|uniref:Peptidoglycan DD-metalloendopeptidase family protein n=1 Tax=Pelistega europaea TaxID=106147 RepID=A0A7Y4LA12_9BURK|nr:peptidoglycan DD-metalloendopeptidase family protein [Pelistega europaea]NOL49643.1 peptidoglycan DD-metalloendopeptidase family protein [Pelistega europaea]